METSKKKVDEQKSVQSGIRCSADDSQKQLSRFRQLLQQNSLQLKDASLQIQTVLRVLENLEVPTKKVRALIGIFLLVCRRRKCASTWSRNI